MKISFEQMPSNARTWVYTSNRLLTASEAAHVLEQLNPFLEEWSSHGTPLKAACQLLDQSVIVVAVEDGWEAASGCSIDKSVRVLKNLEQELGITWFDRLQVLYRPSLTDSLQFLPLSVFKHKLSAGEVQPSGYIANTQVTAVGELGRELWQKVEDSWLAKFLPSTPV